MNRLTLIIDGGTSNTKVALLKDGKIINYKKFDIGASSSDSPSKRNINLETLLVNLIKEYEKEYDDHVSKIICSGMITSNLGLKEIYHINTPATLQTLTSNIRPHVLDNISEDISFYFVPGLKTMEPDGKKVKDVMRGQETQVFAMLKEEDYGKNILFINFGARSKAILFSNDAIVDSITTMSGEVLWAICKDTTLKNNIGTFENLIVHESSVIEGYESCKKDGFTRTLFKARIDCITGNDDENKILSYILGALMYSDLKIFLEQPTETLSKIVVYGRNNFLNIFKICVDHYFSHLSEKLDILDYEESEKLSIEGLRIIQEIIENRK